ncbi:MAG TPA: histidine ammonia-lyase [Polyangiaceae bacterium]|nr:histidine ammonia-lyase [Polyangiaceae bacterium]
MSTEALPRIRLRSHAEQYTVAMTSNPAEPLLLGEPITLHDLEDVARRGRRVELAPAARLAVRQSRAIVDALDRATPPRHVYGVNTGFGALSEVLISPSDVRTLQRNLLRSHACGVGPDLGADEVRAMMVLRAQVLSLGHSGVRELVVDRLVLLLNRGVVPRIPAQGSVGASGDLAPLAHLSLVLIGEGEATFEGARLTGREALERAGIEPIVLESKEGLAMINGTQYMAGIGALALLDAARLSTVADIAGAMSLEALKGSQKPFDERLMRARPHPGQRESAANLRAMLAGSGIMESHRDCGKVQDAYSLRCMPQVHGATRDALRWAIEVIERELNSVTDNPLVFASDATHPEPDLISGGNFHGQPLALALDLAAMAVAELANISERRVEQLVNPALSSGLTPFLARQSGLESGFMIAQVTSASLVSENKILAHPASVDSIPSSAGKEDHVSMGSVSARKLVQIIANVTTSISIEVLTASAGLGQRLPLEGGSGVAAAYRHVRTVVPETKDDRPLYRDIGDIARLVRTGDLRNAVEKEIGHLA